MPAQECIRIYQTPTRLLYLFNPSRQAEYCQDLYRCYMGTAPAISTVKNAFGKNTAESWIEIQLDDLSEYAGVRTKLSQRQKEQTAGVILYKFGYLTLTQLMHFFLQFKSGAYGRFYGSVDPMAITQALQSFDDERIERMAKFETIRAREERDKERLAAEAGSRLFRKALAVSNMTVAERLWLLQEYSLTIDEIAEIGWLFRMGYEARPMLLDSYTQLIINQR